MSEMAHLHGVVPVVPTPFERELVVSGLTSEGAAAYPLEPVAPKMLSVEEVCRIHDVLCEDFALAADPIFPPGVKSKPLLESAIGRQHVGFGPLRKYATAEANAETLTFGLCNDNPFHNGNKRTALVSMLAHLEKNRLTLKDTKQNDLFNMVLALAINEMSTFASRSASDRTDRRNTADEEVSALTSWLKPRLQSVKRGERQVTYRELRAILHQFNIELHNPRSNKIDVFRVIKKKKLLTRNKPEVKYQRIGVIGYHSEGQPVSMMTIKDVRRIAGLREEDGCDSEGFYASAAQFDVFINRYRVILRRLSKR